MRPFCKIQPAFINIFTCAAGQPQLQHLATHTTALTSSANKKAYGLNNVLRAKRKLLWPIWAEKLRVKRCLFQDVSILSLNFYLTFNNFPYPISGISYKTRQLADISTYIIVKVHNQFITFSKS